MEFLAHYFPAWDREVTMDREDLDRKLKENGEAMKETSHGSKSSRMKIAALALSMLIIGGAGGCCRC